MRYFDHDTTASGDDLILALRMAHGGAAVDAYWAILEQIYRDEKPAVIEENRPETQALTVRLMLGFEELEKYVSTMVSFGLLYAVENVDGAFTSVMSKRAADNIEAYSVKCETNRLNGQKGGRKTKRKANANRDANRVATQSDSERQAKKRKEKKVLGSDKQNPNTYASGGADAVETAPPSMQCPNCDADLKPTDSHRGDRQLFLCPLCAEEVWL